MQSILLHADGKPGMTARLESALALARFTGGHVTVQFDTSIARYMVMDPMGGTYVMTDALSDALAQQETDAEALAHRLDRQDVAYDIVQNAGETLEALSVAARLADCVVVSREGGIAGELALHSGAPVLAVPTGRPLAMPIETACIAFDGSPQSAAALKAAVPLLKGCRDVRVLTVCEGESATSNDIPPFPATESLRYLSRHGVTASLDTLSRRGSVEETLMVAVSQARADLLVMGAFGTSRLREYLFGGVTKFFLTEPGAPALLLAH